MSVVIQNFLILLVITQVGNFVSNVGSFIQFILSKSNLLGPGLGPGSAYPCMIIWEPV